MIKLIIRSYDGKLIEVDEVEKVYFTAKNSGDITILSNHLPLVSLIDVSIFHYEKNNEKVSFSTSGGIIYFSENICQFYLETFESKDEINKDKILEKRDRLENELKSLPLNDLKYEVVEKRLKKALNRLKLID